MDNVEVSIDCLPDEVIAVILVNNNCREVARFGATCKRFHGLVSSNQSLWKDKFKRILPVDVYQIIENKGGADWLHELKIFYTLKQQIYSELLLMSPKYYWRNEVTLEDIGHFFNIALSSSMSYYYSIYILQDLVKKGKLSVDKNRGVKYINALIDFQPFTLTEIHYARLVLRYLIHIFLSMKWVKSHIKNELPPEIVINFFLQWIDIEALYSDEDVENKMTDLEKRVETILKSSDSLSKKNLPDKTRELRAKGLASDTQVLGAISQVIYQQRHMAVTSAANLDTLNVLKVLANKCGNVIVVAAIYQAVSKRCGLRCELIAFPNHLFLEWRSDYDDPNAQVYTIDLGTGELKPKRRCPFSQNTQSTSYRYCPDSLLQYLYSAYNMSMGSIKNWNTQNALHLLDFLGTNYNENNPYRNFLSYLLDHVNLPEVLNTSLDLRNLTDVHIGIIRSLRNLDSLQTSKLSSKKAITKQHDSRVKYAVGMVCYHKKYDYVCILRGWDVACAVDWKRDTPVDSLQFGHVQPFYYVVAADQSERYVAQENLIEITRPTRLYHLEEIISREFTHFDGFAYVPNDQKLAEYPGEGPICSMYRSRAELKP